MSFTNSLHANAAPQHFERIAKNLLSQRNSGDNSSCDLKFKLKNGDVEHVHSMVVCAHSNKLCQLLEKQRSPYQPIDMRDFDATSVKRVIDWMYSGNIDIPASSLSQDLAVAAYLRIPMLQNQFENKIRNMGGSPITALNIASARSFSVLDETMNRLVLDLAEAIPRLKASEIAQLTQNSIIATMAAMLSMEQKVPLINMAILWILTKKPGRGAVNAIIQSLVVGDITFDTLYSLRYSLKQYLTNPDLAGKTELSISPSGTIGLKIDIKRHGAPTRQSRDNSVKSSSSRSNCSVSSSDKRYGCNTKKCQMYRTRSELSSIAHMPDPFGPDRLAPSPNFVRETTAGVPVYFTRSEVEDLHKMKDPFQQADNESAPPAPCTKKIYGFSGDKYTVKYPGWNPNSAAANIAAEKAKRASMAARYTPSDIQVVRNMPDPFVSYSDCVGPSTAAEKAKRASMAARYTPSDIQVVQNMPDPFVGFNQNSAAANVAKEREKQAAMAARYTPSDIQVVRNMPDPFVKSPIISGWNPEAMAVKMTNEKSRRTSTAAKFSESEINFVKSMPDPFVGKTIIAPTQGPVVLKPATSPNFCAGRASRSKSNILKARPSFSGNSNRSAPRKARSQTSRPRCLVTTISDESLSSRSGRSDSRMLGLRKTASEIAEINALPTDFPAKSPQVKLRASDSSSSHSTTSGVSSSKSNSNKDQKTRHRGFQRSEYLYHS